VSTAPLVATASAACPDVEVIFARGRPEPPGVGAVGDALVNSLRAQVPGSIGVCGVNYPAHVDAGSGANDIGNHARAIASGCRTTRMVIGGYSLGPSHLQPSYIGSGLVDQAATFVAGRL
jgi:cutinase